MIGDAKTAAARATGQTRKRRTKGAIALTGALLALCVIVAPAASGTSSPARTQAAGRPGGGSTSASPAIMLPRAAAASSSPTATRIPATKAVTARSSPTRGPSPTATPRPTHTAVPTATPRPTHTPVPTPTATPRPYVPPAPVLPAFHGQAIVHTTNGYQVGAYYFSGWSRTESNNLTPILLHGPLSRYEPLASWYDDSQALFDENLDQAASSGVDFFAFDYYVLTPRTYTNDQTVNEALNFYLHSKHRTRMNFALNFVDQEPFLPRPQDWPALVKTWIGYFKQPDYVRVNSKPLFIVFSPENMRKIFVTSQRIHAALDYLRGMARKAGLPGVTVAVGTTLTPTYNPSRIPQLENEGYDVYTGYNYHAMGAEKYRTPAPYSALVQENIAMWDRVASHFTGPYIPTITSGWDQRFSYREQSTAIIYEGRTPGQFYCYAAAARRWIDMHPKETPKERMVLVYAWNENGEGGAIVPNKVYRYAYTNALHQAFVTRPVPAC